MPTLSYELTNEAMIEITNAFALMYNYQETINGELNPENKNQFARRMIAKMIKQKVRQYRDIEAAKLSNQIELEIT